MTLISKLGIAKTGTNSLRATVPEGIVAFLELSEGDKIDWKMEIMNGERVVIVRKVKPDDVSQIALKYAKPKREE